MFTEVCTIGKESTTIDPYEELANAIIIRAAEDYEKCLSGGDFGKIKALEHFFVSDWFRILSKADGQYIIDRIKSKFIK